MPLESPFWIKTDIERRFNLQVHSGDTNASVYGFSVGASELNKWKRITAPEASFTTPPWTGAQADWAQVNKIQVTAFGSGPYDGKLIKIDSFEAVRQPSVF